MKTEKAEVVRVNVDPLTTFKTTKLSMNLIKDSTLQRVGNSSEERCTEAKRGQEF